jgi:hypothetical protein
MDMEFLISHNFKCHETFSLFYPNQLRKGKLFLASRPCKNSQPVGFGLQAIVGPFLY